MDNAKSRSMSIIAKTHAAMSAFKTTARNFEWPGLVGIFAFLSLGFMSLTQGYPYMACVFVLIGILFVLLACYNSYKHKSTELIDRYEDRFFIKMKQERKFAAQYLLGQIESNAHLKTVLDFFQAPIADKLITGQLDKEQIFNYFRHWIILYWIAAQKDIETYRAHDSGAWDLLQTLYDTMIDMQRKKLGARYTDWSTEHLREALLDEASLIY